MNNEDTEKIHNRIIRLIAEYGYVTEAEIREMLPGYRKAEFVLRYLEKTGKLGSFETNVKPKKAYCLSNRERRRIEANGQLEYVNNFEPYGYRESTFFHHTSLVKVQLILEHVMTDKMVRFVPEYYTRKMQKMDNSNIKKICDGEFIFLNKNGEERRAGVEIELNLKNTSNRKRLVRNLYAHAKENLDIILLFYASKIIRNKIKESISKYGNGDTPLYLIDLHSFYKLKREVEAEKLDGQKVKIFQ